MATLKFEHDVETGQLVQRANSPCAWAFSRQAAALDVSKCSLDNRGTFDVENGDRIVVTSRGANR